MMYPERAQQAAPAAMDLADMIDPFLPAEAKGVNIPTLEVGNNFYLFANFFVFHGSQITLAQISTGWSMSFHFSRADFTTPSL